MRKRNLFVTAAALATVGGLSLGTAPVFAQATTGAPASGGAATNAVNPAPNYCGVSMQIANKTDHRITFKNLHESHTLILEAGETGKMERKGQVETDVKFVAKADGKGDVRVDANNPNTSWPNIKLTKSADPWKVHDEFKRFSVDDTWDIAFQDYKLWFKRTGDSGGNKQFIMEIRNR